MKNFILSAAIAALTTVAFAQTNHPAPAEAPTPTTEAFIVQLLLYFSKPLN